MFYHKYRPKFFREVIGQEIVVKILKNFLEKEPPHGYLFAGERGTGKTSVARIYAKALNCLNRKDSEPCGECLVCKLFDENKFLDVIEIDAASHRRIEDIRNLQEHIGFKPLQGKYKVFIIDEAHSLTEEASNALLKTLEEPPPSVIFILATTEPQRVLPTIHSRTQRLDFRRISLPKIVEKLKFICEKESIPFEESALYLVAEESGGSLRDAETLLEKVSLSLNPHSKLTEELVADFLGQVSLKSTLELIELISQNKIQESLNFLHQVYLQGYDLEVFLKSLIKTLREIIFLKIHPEFQKHLVREKPEEMIEKMKKLAQNFSLEKLRRLISLLFEADSILKREPPSPLIPLELALVEYFELK